MILTFLLVTTSLFSSTCLFFSVRKNLEFMDKIETLGNAIQLSLDVLEEQYENINKKTKIDLFSDDPIVKDLVVDIMNARNSVLNTAILLDKELDSLELKEKKE